jgi:hypothetical protein
MADREISQVSKVESFGGTVVYSNLYDAGTRRAAKRLPVTYGARVSARDVFVVSNTFAIYKESMKCKKADRSPGGLRSANAE